MNLVRKDSTTTERSGEITTGTSTSFYQEDDTTLAAVTFKGNAAGSANSIAIAITITRVGRIVTIGIPSLGAVPVYSSGTTSYLEANTVLPTWATPSLDKAFTGAVVFNNGNPVLNVLGMAYITTTGRIRFYRDAAGTAYTNSANAGWERVSLTYQV